MPIHGDKNLYPGINPHLNSALQQKGGGWKSFHAYHLIHIAETLNEILPSHYVAKPEESLQINIYDGDLTPPIPRPSSSVADVLIRRSVITGQPSTPHPVPLVPTLRLSIPDLAEDEDILMALVIYEGEKPITRIELLSPANKPGGTHYGDYIKHRTETLYAGLRLVEVDYLHERHPIIAGVPSYRAHHPDAYPYHIIVSDPRPTFSEGSTDVYSFGVLMEVLTIVLPLDGDASIQFDFGAVYQRTLGQQPFHTQVDYTQEPVNFGAYTDEDQARIRGRMAAIAAGQP
jgi:hypothetical protein